MSNLERITNLLNLGHNILVTGGAGTGKSYTLRHVIQWAEDEDLNIARTAMTGMASLQFDFGETLHRCLGLGVNKSLREIMSSWKYRNETQFQIRSIDILIIDEVSMLRSDTLELADSLLRATLDSEKAFGGLQVILSGDFMQLPPVVKPEEKENFKTRGAWAFESPVWRELDLKIVYLTEIKRQDDPKFAMALNMIRAGAINQSVDEYFQKTINNEIPKGVTPVRIMGTNNEVNRVNANCLKKVEGPEEKYQSEIKGKSEHLIEKLKNDCIAMEELVLKPGAQVMILINGSNYVNGSMGEYLGMAETEIEVAGELVETEALLVRLFSTDETVCIAENTWKIEKKTELSDGKKHVETLASFTQFPVKLGWAITIHKSQGMTIDYLQVDLMRCFAEGMAYVALSRSRSYEGLKIVNWRPQIVKCNKDAFNFYMGLKNTGEI